MDADRVSRWPKPRLSAPATLAGRREIRSGDEGKGRSAIAEQENVRWGRAAERLNGERDAGGRQRRNCCVAGRRKRAWTTDVVEAQRTLGVRRMRRVTPMISAANRRRNVSHALPGADDHRLTRGRNAYGALRPGGLRHVHGTTEGGRKGLEQKRKHRRFRDCAYPWTAPSASHPPNPSRSFFTYTLD